MTMTPRVLCKGRHVLASRGQNGAETSSFGAKTPRQHREGRHFWRREKTYEAKWCRNYWLLVLTPRFGCDRRIRPPTRRGSSLTTRNGTETTGFGATTRPRSPPTPRGSSLMHQICAETAAGARPGSGPVISFALLSALKLIKFEEKCCDAITPCCITL